jgi:hypothetical protein
VDQLPAQPEAAPHAPISRLIHSVAERLPAERITFGELAAAFRDRGFGVLILTFTLPSLIPGVAAVFGLPLLIVGLQMALGRHVIALPAFVARQSIRRVDLLRFADFSSSWLKRIERFVRPRPGLFLSNAADRAVGWLTVYSAIMIVLPGPGTNGPPAFGCIVMALGLIENDSRTVGIGMVLTVLGNLFATVALGILGYAMVKAVSWAL